MNLKLKKIRGEEHPGCLLCGQSHPRGMKLDFKMREDGSVEATVKGSKALEGYRGILHGGVIAALLDSAMTNCLFAKGIRALTAEMNVRFLSPVRSRGILRVEAKVERAYGNFYALSARLSQGTILKAKATGKFLSFSKLFLERPARASGQASPGCRPVRREAL